MKFTYYINPQTANMSNIKCIENYINLKKMFMEGEKGDAAYFTSKLNISTRTFHRLLKCLKEIEHIDIKFNKYSKFYYLD